MLLSNDIQFVLALPNYFINMSMPKVCVVAILLCSLLLQIFNLANVVYADNVQSTIDVINSPYKGYSSFKQQNNGNNTYIAASSSICFTVYLYLFIVTLINKSCSKKVDKGLLVLAVCFQFGIAVTYFLFVVNNKGRFESALQAIDNLEAIQEILPAGDPLPDLVSYRNLFVLRSMCIAAGVLSLLICVIGGLLLLIRERVVKQEGVDGNESVNEIKQTQPNNMQASVISQATELK